MEKQADRSPPILPRHHAPTLKPPLNSLMPPRPHNFLQQIPLPLDRLVPPPRHAVVHRTLPALEHAEIVRQRPDQRAHDRRHPPAPYPPRVPRAEDRGRVADGQRGETGAQVAGGIETASRWVGERHAGCRDHEADDQSVHSRAWRRVPAVAQRHDRAGQHRAAEQFGEERRRHTHPVARLRVHAHASGGRQQRAVVEVQDAVAVDGEGEQRAAEGAEDLHEDVLGHAPPGEAAEDGEGDDQGWVEEGAAAAAGDVDAWWVDGSVRWDVSLSLSFSLRGVVRTYRSWWRSPRPSIGFPWCRLRSTM